MVVTSCDLLDLVHGVLMEGDGNRLGGESDRITGYWVLEALQEAHSGAITSRGPTRPCSRVDQGSLGAGWRSRRVCKARLSLCAGIRDSQLPVLIGSKREQSGFRG